MLCNRGWAAVAALTCRLAAGCMWDDFAMKAAPLPGAGSPRVTDFKGLPLAFESNEGQFDAGIRFISRTPEAGVYLSSDRIYFALGSGNSRYSPGRLHPAAGIDFSVV